ncbi:diguanylate cyclase (GGDEF)-like protein [Paraburkholderia caballeronis]|nr:diguanylate cyclase (GGDEF)-like protein [Paraburkholderia caballeronis]TDV09941.1 diguanylate cyclase (GGDEF)-like protein [Paraburkholderia caballeronis]TDV21773.1 diguanylate cyclase (GGDEF)-like protein [Paraburkholderia caballeronis]
MGAAMIHGPRTGNAADRRRPMPLTRLAGVFITRPFLFAIAGIVGALATACVVAVSLYEMREDALARARDTTESLSVILERDIERNVEFYELSIQEVLDGATNPAVLQSPPEVRHLALFDRSTNARDMGSVLVTDADGNVVLDSRSVRPGAIDLSDNDYFKVQQQTADAGLYISKPFLSRLAGEGQAIGLSRRIDDPRGQFAGIVVGTLRLNYFRRLFAGMTLGPHGSITLLRTDGTVLMRRPYREADIGRNISAAASVRPLLRDTPGSGSFIGFAALDGAQRLYSFSHVGKYPLVVVVALATRDIYAEWTQRAWIIGSVMGVLDLLLVAMSILLAKQFRRRLEMERQLKRLADTDGLTGLGTRRALDTTLDIAWRVAQRTRQPLAVLMVDVDNFKSYNDLYGHPAGDDALKLIARCVADSLHRPGDFAGRYGGEEFCVLLPDTALAGAIEVAERIRAAVLAKRHPHDRSPGGVLSISIGVGSFDGAAGAHADTGPERLIREADQWLYEAKAAGRNRVMPLPPPVGVSAGDPAPEMARRSVTL